MRDFSKDYAAGAEDLLAFYTASPERLRETPPVAEPWPPELVESIARFQSARGGSATTGCG